MPEPKTKEPLTAAQAKGQLQAIATSLLVHAMYAKGDIRDHLVLLAGYVSEVVDSFGYSTPPKGVAASAPAEEEARAP